MRVEFQESEVWRVELQKRVEFEEWRVEFQEITQLFTLHSPL